MTDRQTPFSISLFGSQAGDAQDAAAPSRVQQALVDFIMEFTLDNIFVYRYARRCKTKKTMSNICSETKYVKMCFLNSTTATLTLRISSATARSLHTTLDRIPQNLYHLYAIHLAMQCAH
jgi:uncharacterized ion transporter superfamily protein YfcC